MAATSTCWVLRLVVTANPTNVDLGNDRILGLEFDSCADH